MAENIDLNAGGAPAPQPTPTPTSAPTPVAADNDNPAPQNVDGTQSVNPPQPQATEGEKDAQKTGGSFLDVYNDTDEEGDKPQDGDGQEIEYKFTREDGQEVSPEDVQTFTSVAKDLKLNQEQAQKLYQIANEKVAAINEQKLRHAQDVWEKAIVADQELGGTNLNQTRRNVATAMKRYGTPQFKNLLIITGLGSHPEVVRVFNQIGKEIGNDQQFINGNIKPKTKEVPYPLYAGVDSIVQE